MRENIDHLDKELSSKTATISARLKSEIDSIKNKLRSIDYELAIIEYEKEQCDENKLTSAINLVKYSESVGYDWQTSRILSDIKKLLISGAQYDPGELPEVFDTLKDVSESNRKQALEIEKIILKSDK